MIPCETQMVSGSATSHKFNPTVFLNLKKIVTE